MDKLTAFGFIFAAFAAVFIGAHKEDIEKGQFKDVVASYVEE